MSRGALLADLAIAVLAAALVVTVTPGVAVAALIAILVLVVCFVSFLLGSRRGRVTSRRGDRPPPRRRR